MHLSPDETERRLPVWHALSRLFLTARPGKSRHKAANRRIARALAASSYTDSELRHIFIREVLPAFWPDTLDDWAHCRPHTPDQVRRMVLNPVPDTRTRFERAIHWIILWPELRAVMRDVRRFRKRARRP